MAFIRNTNRLISPIKTFLPRTPVQHFHSLNAKSNPLRSAPAAFLPLQQRVAAPTVRPFSTTPNLGPDKDNMAYVWALIGLSAVMTVMPPIAQFLMPDQSVQPEPTAQPSQPETEIFEKTTVTKMEGQVLTAHMICLEIQKSYDNLSLNQIKETLSRDYFPDEESFAKHVIDFEKSTIKATIPLDDSFRAYRNARHHILQVANKPSLSDDFGKKISLNGPCIPPEIGYLKDLEELFLSYSRISNFPDSLAQLKSLRKLSMYQTGLEDLPSVITKLTGLTYLDLKDNQLESLPDDIGNLTQLKKLYLSCNKLTRLPESFGKLTELETLELWGNKLTLLPEGIGSFSKLRDLGLSHNQLSTLPETFKDLNELEEISLSDNKFSQVPDSILSLPNLANLKMNENQITQIPPAIGNLNDLKYLNLSRNQIAEIPAEIFKLTQLTDLILSHNKITSLPEDIGKLQEIGELNLSSNKLTSLPATIGNMTELVFLYLGNNQLTVLPQEIGNLRNLYRLHLENNSLKTVPASIINLRLSELNLADNHLDSLPLEMAKRLESDPWKRTTLNLHGFPAKGQWETLSDEQKQLLLRLKTFHDEGTGQYYLSYSSIPKQTADQKQTAQ
ncbi:MAG: leucine-rich repeat domain-containing protein [Alphaproteobacteria bacterium]|nr:leucine-rich repeat domain-containing protein [Alphaproteobacteria bacterium]